MLNKLLLLPAFGEVSLVKRRMLKHLCSVWYSHLHWGQAPWKYQRYASHPHMAAAWNCIAEVSIVFIPPTLPHFMDLPARRLNSLWSSFWISTLLGPMETIKTFVNQPGIIKYTKIMHFNVDKQAAVAHTLLQALLMRSSNLGKGTVRREGNFRNSPANFNLCYRRVRARVTLRPGCCSWAEPLFQWFCIHVASRLYFALAKHQVFP